MSKTSKARKVVHSFVHLLREIEERAKARQEVLNTAFWEFNNLNTNMLVDNSYKYKKYITERKSYPNAFLASSLGFTKSSILAKHMEILGKFGLDRIPREATLKNGILFERLKNLILKYFEVKKLIEDPGATNDSPSLKSANL
ncbi:hypothetical protein ENBRE01_2491 [Enteropsectra breve]|nr:hypothetical protein ENBRE01_2491 [Enteropsectra breve]